MSEVSILGMLEGVLKAVPRRAGQGFLHGFNPWYVGGGVKSNCRLSVNSIVGRFNPWYVGGGVKSGLPPVPFPRDSSFNPWYVGGGVKRLAHMTVIICKMEFQSLVCWRGC